MFARLSLSPTVPVMSSQGVPVLPGCPCSPRVLTEVLPGPPVLLDAYEGALELGRELGLAPGPLSALLGIVRRTIAACAETPLPRPEECYSYFSELLLRHAVHVSPCMPLAGLLAPTCSWHTPCTLVGTCMFLARSLHAPHMLIGTHMLPAHLAKPTQSSPAPCTLAGAHVLFACSPHTYQCPKTPCMLYRCLQGPQTVPMQLSVPAHSLPASHRLTRTQTLPPCSLRSFLHTTGILLPFSPMPTGSLYAPLPSYAAHTLPSPACPLPAPAYGAIPAAPPGQCGCVQAKPGGACGSLHPRHGPSACQALCLRPHTRGLP
ncbi:uncharacterized protein [Struthio camelus]|uniref:uncharacterized protein n=1 Tax=Struthio camelus TaxID=8801 RepID=UPI003603F3C9